MSRYRRDGHGHRAILIQPGTRFHFLTVLRLAGKRKRLGLLWLCRCDCGKKKIISGSFLRYKHGRKSCGCYQPAHRKGADNPLWTGGRYVDPSGYVYVTAKGHGNANQRGYVLEHVLVMSRKIGRPLKSGESVHHLNGIRGDNRPENLELWVSTGKYHRAGQRASDLVSFAESILREYAPEKLR